MDLLPVMVCLSGTADLPPFVRSPLVDLDLLLDDLLF